MRQSLSIHPSHTDLLAHAHTYAHTYAHTLSQSRIRLNIKSRYGDQDQPRWLKNQLDRFALLASCCWRPATAGTAGPSPPPPRNGFAIRDPALLKLKPPLGAVGEAKPRVEPTLAASSRSLTAVSCASNLQTYKNQYKNNKAFCFAVIIHCLLRGEGREAAYLWFAAVSFSCESPSKPSRLWILSFRAISLRSAMATSFFSELFCSTSCRCTTVSCSRLRSRNAIFFC